jgi:hypothetical protein
VTGVTVRMDAIHERKKENTGTENRFIVKDRSKMFEDQARFGGT